MSKRRKIGDKVWVVPGAIWGINQGRWAIIIEWSSNSKDLLFPCCLNCGDDDCMEWNDLVTEDKRSLYHVSECEMLDAPEPEE